MTEDVTIPDEARQAAFETVTGFAKFARRGEFYDDIIQRALEAAAPHILAAALDVDAAMRDKMRERLHDSNCGCGEWDSHSEEYVAAMDSTIDDVLWPLRNATKPTGSDHV